MESGKIIVEITDDEIRSHGGLALIGEILARSGLAERVDALRLKCKPRPQTPHSAVIKSMVGLLCLGKSDYNDIEAFRGDGFFRRAMGVEAVPSEPTLRQRIEEIGAAGLDAVLESACDVVTRFGCKVTPCHKNWASVDVDVTPCDNSGTKKEGVSCTYKKVDGYAPIFAYVGEEGYVAHVELRPGSQHCQKGTPAFLRVALARARRMTSARLLVRMDAGNDAGETLETLRREKVDFIIKRNLRRESVSEWAQEAQALGQWREEGPGRRRYVGDKYMERGGRLWRVVFDVVERYMDENGQRMMFSVYDVATYWTSLGPRQADCDEVIELYRRHGTSEQFHSEIKGDLDLERLPSGKFAANALVLACGVMAYNILRVIDQIALDCDRRLPATKKMPLAKPVKRRRVRSVIQDLMYMACRLVHHARYLYVRLARRNRFTAAWHAVYESLRAPPLIYASG